MQHTGVTGSPAVTRPSQMSHQQQLLSQQLIHPGAECLAPPSSHPQGRDLCLSPVPTPASQQSLVGYTQLYILGSFLFTFTSHKTASSFPCYRTVPVSAEGAGTRLRAPVSPCSGLRPAGTLKVAAGQSGWAVVRRDLFQLVRANNICQYLV